MSAFYRKQSERQDKRQDCIRIIHAYPQPPQWSGDDDYNVAPYDGCGSTNIGTFNP
jgi:hypothetical protein